MAEGAGWRRPSALGSATAVLLVAQLAQGAGPSVVVIPEGDVDRGMVDRIAAVIRSRRSVMPLRPLPPEVRSPEELANEERIQAIAQALNRARKHEEVAAWDDCAKEAGNQLGVATELLATSGKLELLRDLHIQIGVCMSLGAQGANAQPHFELATLLDESAPSQGLHREEAELAHHQARAEVLGRTRGPVRIETDPPGAEVWIDGQRVAGVTPVDVPVRLGNHFVTLRRFRYEPETNRALLQPKTKLRFVLGGARRTTLRQQLGQVGAGKLTVSRRELQLAQGEWSKAAQVAVVDKLPGPTTSVRLTLVSTAGGQTLRSRALPLRAADEELRDGVCSVLGETCEPPDEGIPWYVWPIAGAAAIGIGVTVGFIIDSQRETVFCPARGCN